MTDTIVANGTPEIQLGFTAPKSESVPPTFSGKWEDMAKDMAAIEAEQGQQQPAQPESQSQPAQAVVTEPQPTQPSTQGQAQTPGIPVEAAKPEIPEKFRAPNGTLDQDKVLKSYLEAERTLKRLQNQQAVQPGLPQAMLPQPMAQQQPQAQQPMAVQPTQFELQVAQDLINEAAAFGERLSPGLALATARTQVRLLEAKHQAGVAATFAEVEGFRQTLQDQAREKELKSLADRQPWVMTPAGQAELIKIRQENEWINRSPEPWRAAALHLIGQHQLMGSSGQVMPTPTATQQGVPPLPVVAAQRTTNPVQLNTQEEISAYVKMLSPEQEAEFWRKAGLKWDAPKKTYQGYSGI